MQTTGNQLGREHTMWNNALKGAIAGAVGVWVMDRLDWYMFRHEDPRARQRTEEVRPGGLDPAHAAVNKLAHAFGTELVPAQPHPAGIALHYAIGIAPAAAYGALRERLPRAPQEQDFLYGLGMGLGLFLIQDEGLNQVMGISAKQKDYPWQAHARGLVAHLTLGLVTNAVLNLLNVPPAGGKNSQARTRPIQAEDDYFVPSVATGRTGAGAVL